jgi:hypothetical protein
VAGFLFWDQQAGDHQAETPGGSVCTLGLLSLSQSLSVSLFLSVSLSLHVSVCDCVSACVRTPVCLTLFPVGLCPSLQWLVPPHPTPLTSASSTPCLMACRLSLSSPAGSKEGPFVHSSPPSTPPPAWPAQTRSPFLLPQPWHPGGLSTSLPHNVEKQQAPVFPWALGPGEAGGGEAALGH